MRAARRGWSLRGSGAVLMAVATLTAGCAAEDVETGGDSGVPTAAAPADPETAARAAVEHADRPEDDRADDGLRKPAEVLAFLQIEPGMRVLDLLAGDGYYTEILARAVGAEGTVVYHNNAAYRSFLGEDYPSRLADGRLGNVERLDSEVLELDLEPESLDAAVLILGFHDIWFRPEEGGWEELTPEAVLQPLFAALRPGGVLGIVDHAALEGADPSESANALHRVDEAVVIREVEAAGFELEATSDVLRNPDDDRETLVFDPSIRRRTDRFVHRYRKPEVAVP